MRRVLRTEGCLLVLCESGEASMHVSLHSEKFSKGQILILTPDIYCCVDEVSADFMARYISLSSPVIDKAYYKIPNSAFWEYLRRSPVLNPGSEARRLFEDWMAQTVWVLENAEGATLMEMLGNNVYNLFAALDIMLASVYNDKKGEPKFRGWSIVARFLSLLASHSSARNGVGYYADKLCITPDYLYKLCRSMYGTTPKRIIEEQLVVDIKTFLTDTDLPVGVIAHRLGFSDASYMSRMFRRATGVAPSRFRNSY